MPLAPCLTPETLCLYVCLHSPASNYDLAEGKKVQLAAADVASLNALKLSTLECCGFFSMFLTGEHNVFTEITSCFESQRLSPVDSPYSKAYSTCTCIIVAMPWRP